MRLSLALVAFATLLLAACGSSRTSRVEDGEIVMEEAEEAKEPKANTTKEEPKPRKGRTQEELEALGYDMGRTLYGKD